MRLYAAVSGQTVGWNLTFGFLVLYIVFIGIIMNQTWLWQDALTPEFGLVNRAIAIPVVRTGRGSYEF